MTSTRRRKEWSGASSSALTGASATNNKKSALSAAYAELGKELMSGKLRTVGTYTLGRAIGEGTYGKVRLATHRLSGTRVAIKQVPKAHSATLTREIHHHRRLHHPNVMQLYEVLASESYIWMVTELCAGGELYDYLVERGTMPEPEARRIFGQLCLAVAYVHNRGIVHRDLKLENVLLDERCNVKLGDFGFTREFEGKKLMETFCGTTGYAAPEMLAGRRYTGEEVDVWSLGVILYALVCGALPFDDDDEAVMKAKILHGEYELPDVLSEECRDLIALILQQDPGVRPSIKSILSHAWFTKVMGPIHMETVDEDAQDMSGQHTEQDAMKGAEPGAGTGLLIVEPNTQPVASPGPMAADDLAHKASASSISATSFFSARSKSDSDASDRKSSDTGTTNPTTEEGDQEQILQSEQALDTDDDGEGQTERRPLSWKHRNESQTTIKRQTSSGSDTSRKAAPKAASTPLPTHVETSSETTMNEPEEHSNSAPPALVMSTPLEQKSSQNSARAGGSGASGHHRTPSRTKRRSSGGLSDHHPPSLDVRPVNYVAQLEDCSTALFSTVVEQNLLHQLSMLGLDVGQIVHSVVNEACDASGAMWWILKKKAEEREQQHEADANHSLWAFLRDAPRSRKNSNSSQILVPSSSITNAVSPAWQSRELVRPTAVKAANPQRVDARNGSDAANAMSAFMASAGDGGDDAAQGNDSVASHSQSTTNAHAERPQRPVEMRTRASSFSARLTSVLAGKDKDKELRKENAGDRGNPTKEERSTGVGERAKSPVIGSLFKKGPDRGSPGPSTPNKADKQKKKDTRSPLQAESRTPVKLGSEKPAVESGDSAGHNTPVKGGGVRASGVDVMHPTTSTETFSTVSSASTTGSPSATKATSKTSKAGFLHTVRNWLVSEEKENVGGVAGGKKKKKRRNAPLPVSNNGTVRRAPSLKGGSALNSPHISRSGSVRRTHVAHNYHSAGSLPRSPRIGQRGASISRRSSSGSVQYIPSASIKPQRPMSIRRQSAGSITPTATLAGVEEYMHHVRGSRPSSAQSFNRATTSNLHARSGSTGSIKSFARIPSHESGYSGSLRGVHSRRTSIDGGTTVRRHRHYPHVGSSAASHSHHHGHVRSDSHSRSRPSTPGRYPDEGGAHDLITPRRSFDSYNGGRASPMHTPRASQSVFVAHRSRTPYKPPSANPSLMRVEHDQSSYDQSYGAGAYMHGYGHRVPYGRSLLGMGGSGHLPLGTWHRSWGKPPPSWDGPIDRDVGDAPRSSTNLMPKLRDVFAVRESDDDWEDEEDEPTYAGGLGQLASSSWTNDQYEAGGSGLANVSGTPRQWAKSAATSNEAMPASMKTAGVRGLFQPPSLGRETMPKTWITNDDSRTVKDNIATDSIDGGGLQARSSPLLSSKPLPTAGLASTTDAGPLTNTSSRVRSAAPVFKGPITIEEEEEDE